MATQTKQEREAFLATIKADFDERLAKIAADPQQWVTFIDQVAVFGARYSLGNQLLLMMQAEQRGVDPQFFLPYGKKDGSSGWRKYKRQVRKGEVSFKVWAPLKRRPTKEQAKEWETAGRKVRREPSGRPAIHVVGFTLASTFDPLSRHSSLRRDAPVVSLQSMPTQPTRNSDRYRRNVTAPLTARAPGTRQMRAR